MFTELQQLAKKKIRTRALLCVLLLAVILVVFGSSFLKLVQGPVDLYSLSLDELEGTYVEADVDVILDIFAEYTETEKSGRETTVKEYYVVPIGEAEYFGMGFRQNEFIKAGQISNETYEYVMGERSELTSSMHVKGTIKKMNEELSGYFFEWFEESDYSPEELKQYALAYVMEPGDIGIFEEAYVYVALAACAALIVCLVIVLVQGASGSCLSQINRFIANNTSTDSVEKIESDYKNAVSIESIKVGKYYTFYFKGINANIVKNADVIWAYLKRTTHRTNGIKTGVTYGLILNTRNKFTHTIDMKREQGVAAALQQYSMNNPQIILGFSPDLDKCYRRDINAFVNMSAQQEAANSRAAAAAAQGCENTCANAAAGSEGTVSAGSQGTATAGQGDGGNVAGAQDGTTGTQDGATARVVIISSGNNPIMVIKTVREILECGLKEAKDIVDNVPSVLLENIPLNDALAIKEALESHGAVVEVA